MNVRSRIGSLFPSLDRNSIPGPVSGSTQIEEEPKKLQAQLFGSKSKKFGPEQSQLLLEVLEAVTVIDEAGADVDLVLKKTRGKKTSKRMCFPDDLPTDWNRATLHPLGANQEVPSYPGALHATRHPPRGALLP